MTAGRGRCKDAVLEECSEATTSRGRLAVPGAREEAGADPSSDPGGGRPCQHLDTKLPASRTRENKSLQF